MPGKCQDALTEMLFGDEDRPLANLKLLRGDDPSVTKEQLCEEIQNGIAQQKAGEAETFTEFPEEGEPEKLNLEHIE